MSQKSYDGSSILYLIPTPIGNMEDITVRALKILKEVEVIFSEDTRVTAMLLKHFDISKKLIPNHNFNEEENKKKLIDYLSNGYNVGLVSDRGTPIISDPGFGLAKYAIEKGYNVVGLPGATALIPALIMSGISPQPFLFYGFLNNKQGKRIKELEKLKHNEYTLIFYEAPHRIEKTLTDMEKILGNRQICISREISKKFEEVYRGRIEDIKKQMVDIKGELVIIVSGNNQCENYDNLTVIEHVNSIVALGNTLKDAIKEVATKRNVPKSEIYNQYHGIKK